MNLYPATYINILDSIIQTDTLLVDISGDWCDRMFDETCSKSHSGSYCPIGVHCFGQPLSWPQDYHSTLEEWNSIKRKPSM
jgi:hypothetical protein